MPPSPDAVLRTWFHEVWNQGRDTAIEQLFSENGIAHGLPGGDLRGPGGFRALFASFRGAFPDISITVERTVNEGDYTATWCRVTGTHTGDGLGIPPTNQRVEFHGTVIARIADGQIQEGWNCFDFLTMYQQLGLVPVNPGT